LLLWIDNARIAKLQTSVDRKKSIELYGTNSEGHLYNIKSTEPRIDPCGMPFKTASWVDL